MDYAEEHRSLHAAVATDAQPPTETVVRWVQQALEQVVLPSVAESNYTLFTNVTLLGEDLSRSVHLQGVMWDRIPRDEPLEGITITGWNEERAARHEHLEAQVLYVHAGFPIFRRRLTEDKLKSLNAINGRLENNQPPASPLELNTDSSVAPASA